MEVMTASSGDIKGWAKWFRGVARVMDRMFLGGFAMRFYYAAAVLEREAEEVELLTKPSDTLFGIQQLSKALGADSDPETTHWAGSPKKMKPTESKEDVVIYPTPKKSKRPKATVNEPDWDQLYKDLKKLEDKPVKAKNVKLKPNNSKPRRAKAK